MGNIGSRVEKAKPAALPPAGDKIQAKLYRSRFELRNTLALSAADGGDTFCSPATGIRHERDEAAYVERNVLKRNVKAQVMVMAALQSRPHSNNADMELYCAQKGGVNCCLAFLLSPRSGQDSLDHPNLFLQVDEEVHGHGRPERGLM